MEISKESLFKASATVGISKNQSELLWEALVKKEIPAKTSSFSHGLYYLGALIVISAMTWLMEIGWEKLGGGGIFLISVAYAIFFTFIGAKLWKNPAYRTPAGLLITMAVCMTPLAIYGLENYFDLWPKEAGENYKNFFERINGHYVIMELGTILAGIIALNFFPFPFITMPIFAASWFLTMDFASLILGDIDDFDKRSWISLGFGLVLLLISYLIDRNNKREYAFWGYLFGVLTFWGSLSALMWDKGEFVLFIYFVINLLLMLLSLILKRKVFMVFGAIGVFGYLSHLAYTVFQDSILFPFALSAVGLLVIWLGILYQKNIRVIELKMDEILPAWIKNLVPSAQEENK